MRIPEDVIERLAGSPVVSQTRYAGGDISGASEITLADGRVLVAKYGPQTGAEGRMLDAMGRTGAPVPRVLGKGEDVLLIEHLPADGVLAGDGWNSLADALTRLHEKRGTAYGWSESYALRHVAVENATLGNWAQFWAERRLACHFPHIPPTIARRLDTLCARLSGLLPSAPAASLLHGDLWGGNVLVSRGVVSGLIDPCSYYGDREVDAATLTVFDRPPPSFFAELVLDAGWQERQPIYRLWTWLLHVRLFGSSYIAPVERELTGLGF